MTTDVDQAENGNQPGRDVFGTIFAIRRCQIMAAVSPGRADQVSTNPDSTKKKLTPIAP